MELIAQMHSSLKGKNGHGKYMLKKALQKRLPQDVLYRKKQGFGVPIGTWFKTSLYDYARDRLLGQNAFPQDLFDRKALETLVGSREQIGRESKRVWALLTLKLWMDRFFTPKA